MIFDTLSVNMKISPARVFRFWRPYQIWCGSGDPFATPKTSKGGPLPDWADLGTFPESESAFPESGNASGELRTTSPIRGTRPGNAFPDSGNAVPDSGRNGERGTDPGNAFPNKAL